jgi:hypothetical protein
LGIYENEPFGTSTANFVTQISLETFNPTIVGEPEIESVVTVPYFSTLTATEASTGNNTTVRFFTGGSGFKLAFMSLDMLCVV